MTVQIILATSIVTLFNLCIIFIVPKAFKLCVCRVSFATIKLSHPPKKLFDLSLHCVYAGDWHI